MKRLMPYPRPYRRECVLAPLFKMTEAVFELLVPLVVAVIIDVLRRRGEELARAVEPIPAPSVSCLAVRP